MKLIVALATALALWSSASLAQNLPANTVTGRLGIPTGGGPAQAIPFSVLLGALTSVGSPTVATPSFVDNSLKITNTAWVQKTSDAVQWSGAIKVAILGDSRAAPTGQTSGAVSFADYLVAHMPQWAGATITNYAIPGQTLTQVNANYATTAGSSLPAAGQKGYLILVYHGEINSCLVGGITNAATSFATLQVLIGKADADGWSIILATEPPASSITGACETTRQAYNNLIINTYTSSRRLVRPDLAFPDTTDTNIFVDGIHPMANGANLTAGLIAQSILYTPMFASTGTATRTMGKLGVNSLAEPVYTLDIAGSSTTGYPVLSITDRDSSGHQFLLYARCASTAQDFCLYDQTTNNSTSFKWISKANGDFQLPNGSLFVGTALTTGTSTATPKVLDLGDTFSNTAGANLKLQIYHSTAGTIGIGVSVNQMDFVGNAVAYTFYNAAAIVGQLGATGALSLGTAGSNIGSVTLKNATSGSIKIQPATGALGSSVWTVQGGTDTFVGASTTDTLANKTLTTPVINGLPTGTGVATANTASTLMARDGSGNFSAGLATVTGFSAVSSAGTATIIKIQATATGGRDYWWESTDNGNGNGGGKLILFDNTGSVVRASWESTGGVFANVGAITSGSYVKTSTTVVASLPSASGAGPGTRYMVTDANSSTFGATAVGGGANIMPVFSDGTLWKIGGWLLERDLDPANDNVPAFMAKVG